MKIPGGLFNGLKQCFGHFGQFNSICMFRYANDTYGHHSVTGEACSRLPPGPSGRKGGYHLSLFIVDTFLCSVFLIMSKAIVTTTTSTPPVTVMCSGISSITTAVTMASTAAVPAASGQHDVVLLPRLSLRNTVRNPVGLASVLWQQHLSPRCLLRHMPTMPWVLHKWVSLSEYSLTPIYYCMLVFVIAFLSAFRYPWGCHVHQ